MLVRENKYISSQDKDFFILLRIGLWQTVTEELSSNPDWEYIYRLACEQTVQGLIADGIGIYRREKGSLNITQAENDKFLSASAQIVRRNFTINQKQAEINQILDNLLNPQTLKPLNYFVVKGQEAAKNYPKPMLRCSGDIDYLIQPEQMDSAREALTPLATSIEPYEPYLQHQGFMIGDVEVELHGALHPRLGQQIDKVLDRNQQLLFKDFSSDFQSDFEERSDDPSKNRPNHFQQDSSEDSSQDSINYATFNTEYLLLHCLQHFHWSGLGLRQIIDWVMLIAKQYNSIDWQRVQADIKEMGIQHEWNLFLQFSIDYLGLEPLKPLNSQTLKSLKPALPYNLWLSCKASGNMGHNVIHERKPNFWKRNTQLLVSTFQLYFKTRDIAPATSRYILPVRLSGFWDEFKKKLK